MEIASFVFVHAVETVDARLVAPAEIASFVVFHALVIPLLIDVIPSEIVCCSTSPKVNPDRRPDTLSLTIEPAVEVSFFASSSPALTASKIPNAAVAISPTPGIALATPLTTPPTPLLLAAANLPLVPLEFLPPLSRTLPSASLVVPVAMSVRLVPKELNAPISLVTPPRRPRKNLPPFILLLCLSSPCATSPSLRKSPTNPLTALVTNLRVLNGARIATNPAMPSAIVPASPKNAVIVSHDGFSNMFLKLVEIPVIALKTGTSAFS